MNRLTGVFVVYIGPVAERISQKFCRAGVFEGRKDERKHCKRLEEIFRFSLELELRIVGMTTTILNYYNFVRTISILRVDRVLGFFSCRPNWDPSLTCRRVFPPLILGEDTFACGRGWGSQYESDRA
jgi:hypothetical protein